MRYLLLSLSIFILIAACNTEKPIVLEKKQEVDKILVGGSESVLPILKLLAKAFENDNLNKRIDFSAPGHSGAGIKGVDQKVLHIGATSRDLKSSEKKLGLKAFWFARDALVFSTHSNIKLKELSLNDLRSIYYGKISNWKEFGGPDHEISILDRGDGSSPKVLLYKKSIFNKVDISKTVVVMQRPNDMDKALLDTPYSIGYTSMASILMSNYDINILKLEGIEPTNENVSKGDYYLFRPQGLVVKDDPTGLTKDFIDFIFSLKGQSILTNNGYAPLKETP